MARIALIKLFTGLNLGVSQLSGQLQRAGHDTRIIYFKDFVVLPVGETDGYVVTDYALTNVAARGKEYVWNCHTPFSEREYALLFHELERFQPNLIGLSLTSLTMQAAAEVTARLKGRFSDVPVIWGGAGPTLEPERSLEHADLVCKGEGEELIVELADRLDAGADYADLPDLWLKRAGEIVRNPNRPFVELESIAIPDFARARTIHINDDQIAYDVYPLVLGTQYPIMTQRGCPFSCNFCIESVYQDMFGKKGSLRRRSVDVVIEELVNVKRTLGVRSVMFYDDVFTVNPKWLREFAPRYKREVGLPFWCYTYPTTTRQEDILLLKDAGLRSITMGIQSGSAEMLDHFHRPVAQEKAIEAARIIVDCGVECYCDLITKVHFEREEHLRQTFDFLVAFPREVRSVGFGAMVSFPEFGYTKRVADRGAELAVSDRDYMYYHKLYFLTRSALPRPVVKAIGRSRLFRRFPRLLDALLPSELPFHFLMDDADAQSTDVLNLPHAQAMLPGARVDRGPSVEQAAVQ